MRYRPEIDGLRAIAVVAVILYHARIPGSSEGFLGVDVFFVISGYLITTILLRDVAGRRTGLRGFYERRVRRIVPALGIVLVVCCPLAWRLLLSAQLRDFGKSLAAAAMCVSNLYFLHSSDYFDLETEEKPLIHTWSLGVEEQFYLFFPWPLLWVHRRRPAWLAGVLGAALMASFGSALVLGREHPVTAFYVLPTRAWELLAGAWVAARERRRQELGATPAPGWKGEAIAGAALIVVIAAVTGRLPGMGSLLGNAVVVVATAAVIRWAPAGGPVARLLGARPLASIGLVSYSAYLWHQPILAFVRAASVHEPSMTVRVIAAAASLPLAALSYRWVERPARDLSRWKRGPVLLAAAAGTMALFLFGMWVSGPGVAVASRLPAPVRAEEADITRLVEERDRAILSGECHFNGRGLHQDFDAFMSAWDCWPEGSPRIMVMGDSHAADVAMSLRLAGVAVGEMTGAGCSLVPSLMTPTCRQEFDRVLGEAGGRSLSVLLLANRYDEDELTAPAMAEMRSYWHRGHADLWVMSQVPEFADLAGFRQRAAWHGGGELLPDMGICERSEAFVDALAAGHRDVHAIHARPAFCALDPSGRCGWSAGGQALTTDGHHLTVTAARAFGHQLLRALGAPDSVSFGSP